MVGGLDVLTEESERTQTYVIFEMGGERYALEVMRVQEVIDLGSMTQVPGAPRSLKGVLNLRGHVVQVYDLRIPFGLAEDPTPGRAPCVLIVESRSSGENHVTGLLVDRVSDVLEFAPEDVQPAPQLGLEKTSPFVRGVIGHQEGFLLVLDLDRVFTALAGPTTGGGL
ncbi:MAG TPA: chemotaxis protein CheW [Isosphaeraceae bacterium]|jgi:purine-binding chemotaxis protein CheW|nr:chemotaxis protein CheW [Isosphaeraceae bacterium]